VGTADSGSVVVARQLIAWGADSTGFLVRDGSGMSRHNFVTPETMVRVLDTIRAIPGFPAFYEALPVAGTDGTLERRMRGTPAQGNARAKTGSVNRVRALSGYVTTADGHELLFSIFAYGWTTTAREVETAMDSIVASLAAMTVRK